MGEVVRGDLCILGAGAGGLALAAAASRMGAGVVLIERASLGGECLHTGCVPSKALLAAAARVQAARNADALGIEASLRVDFARAMAAVRQTISALEPQDSPARFAALGVRVIAAEGRFTGPDRVEAGGIEVRTRRFVIATGSKPFVPPLPGLSEVPYFTSDTIFANSDLPEHLLVLGGGPMGLELAQAHRRLGARVSVLEAGAVLGAEDPELVGILRRRLEAEGIRILEGAAVTRVRREGLKIALDYRCGEGGGSILGSHLLLAAGRRAALGSLDLDRAGIEGSERGVKVDAGLRTTNRRVYAIGDVAGQGQFTHLAAHHAGIVIRRVLFRLPARTGRQPVPRAIYTDPELAWAGLSEVEARARHGRLRILRQSFQDNDRARIEHRPHGLLKILVGPRGRILGAGILGAEAGDLILPWLLALDRGLKIRAMAGLIAPYPTFSEVSVRAGMDYYAPALTGRKSRALVRFLSRFGG